MATQPTAAPANALVDSLENSINFRDLGALIRSKDMASPKGWAGLAERLNEPNGEFKRAIEPLLLELATSIAVAGNKSASVFTLEPTEADALYQEFLPLMANPNSSFIRSFPLALGETTLATLGEDHELVHRINHSNGDMSLIFCARRTVEERERYKHSEVTQAVQTAFTGYNSFIALRTRPYQVFDVVTLRKSLGRLEVLVDKPARLLAPETTETRTLKLLGLLSATAPSLAPIFQANKPLNLFPCIANLYASASEGKVTMMQFRSPTRSTKREIMTSSDDLRRETFHMAGVHAVGAISIFNIKVEWERMLGVQGPASVLLKAPINALSTIGGLVREAHISDARNDQAVSAVLSKLVSFSSE